MANWFETTNSQPAFAENASTRTVLHGQAAKGEPLSEKSFVIAVSKVPHDDSVDFLKNKATDQVWDDISAAFDTVYHGLVDPRNHMWLINFTKKEDLGDNDVNNQVVNVHIHVLSGKLSPGREFIAEERTFHPHPNKNVYDEFMENKLDVLGLDLGQGLKALPLPSGMKEAAQHYMVTDDKYKSFPEFIEKASREEKRAFWKSVALLALPLVEDGKGARVGYYDLGGDVDAKMGRMAVEIAGGENLGQNGLKRRWFDNPNKQQP
jgi:hypothetical protein